MGDKVYAVCGTFISCSPECARARCWLSPGASSGFRQLRANWNRDDGSAGYSFQLTNLLLSLSSAGGSRCRFLRLTGSGAPAMALD